MKIEIVKSASQEQLEELNVSIWPIWEKEESDFPWFYDSEEQCYIIHGDVTVKTDEEEVRFGAGDLVTFPAGLSCEWIIHKAVKKHYCFR